MKHWVFLENFTGGVIADSATVHRLTRVLRLKPGDTFLGFDGRCELTLRIVSAGAESITVETIEHRTIAQNRKVNLTVAQALLKGRRWDIFLEKTAELGVNAIVPLLTEKTIVKLKPEETGVKTLRWRRIVQSAAAQCRGGTVAEVSEAATFNDFITSASPRAARFLLATGAAAAPFAEALRAVEQKQVILAVGPEGDFTKEEVEAAAGAGFIPVTLGPRILRAETAAIVAAAVILYS